MLHRRCSATHRADASNPRRCRGLTEYVTASAVILLAWVVQLEYKKNSRHERIVTAVMQLCPCLFLGRSCCRSCCRSVLEVEFRLNQRSHIVGSRVFVDYLRVLEDVCVSVLVANGFDGSVDFLIDRSHEFLLLMLTVMV